MQVYIHGLYLRYKRYTYSIYTVFLRVHTVYIYIYIYIYIYCTYIHLYLYIDIYIYICTIFLHISQLPNAPAPAAFRYLSYLHVLHLLSAVDEVHLPHTPLHALPLLFLPLRRRCCIQRHALLQQVLSVILITVRAPASHVRTHPLRQGSHQEDPLCGGVLIWGSASDERKEALDTHVP